MDPLLEPPGKSYLHLDRLDTTELFCCESSINSVAGTTRNRLGVARCRKRGSCKSLKMP
ncbi:hypothetical protein HanPSC8_Chr16g0719151 [Helianthus annuus]|nr:hypothetical protein HanPSC8_Chr16g0719151 [Helianthus annuus]